MKIKRTSAGLAFLNIGCGETYSTEWNNIDLSPSEDVIAHDIRQPFPWEADQFDAVYSSHVLEHLTPSDGVSLLCDIFRILKPDGVIRIAVPDLEAICRLYLTFLDECEENPSQEAAQRYDWMVIELFDQMVRRTSGGMMAEKLRKRDVDPVFLQNRQPELYSLFFEDLAQPNKTGDESIPRWKRGMKYFHIHKILMKLKYAFYAIKAVFFKSNQSIEGELHKWMYDRFSLKRILQNAGFHSIRIVDYNQSEIPDWDRYALDSLPGGTGPRKPDSIYVEAKK